MVMWSSMDIVQFGQRDGCDDDDDGDDDDGDDVILTIRQGPVVHVVEPAVVLGAGGGAEVQVGPGVEVDEVDEVDEEDEELKEMIFSMMI